MQSAGELLQYRGRTPERKRPRARRLASTNVRGRSDDWRRELWRPAAGPRGMEEEQRLHRLLREVGPVVPTAQVRDLVEQYLIQFIGRKLLHHPCRDHD